MKRAHHDTEAHRWDPHPPHFGHWSKQLPQEEETESGVTATLEALSTQVGTTPTALGHWSPKCRSRGLDHSSIDPNAVLESSQQPASHRTSFFSHP